MNLLELAKELEAMAQTGLHFTQDPFDKERYQRLAERSAELLAAQSNISLEEVYTWRAEEFGYATPKVDVRAFIIQDNKVLLVREDADGGRWTLPGGWADVNESPSDSIIREVQEESGFRVKAERLLAVFDREKQGHPPPYPYHIYKLFFHCTITGGAAQKTMECSESAFFARHELPELSIRRVLPSQIDHFFDQVAAGNAATLFD